MSIPALPDASRFFVIAGPCVIESEDHTLHMATQLRDMCAGVGIGLVFKASFDKANRTSFESFRGPGLEEGLRILGRVRTQCGVPVLTDVHEVAQVAPASAVCDMLQVPAFLCRQTDLLQAVGAAPCGVNIKKGQMCSALTMTSAVEKVRAAGGAGGPVWVCDRGNMYGDSALVVDYRNIPRMRANAGADAVLQDITHSVQQPNCAGGITLGERELIPTIGRCAVAAGVDGVFMEVHSDPTNAKSDAATQWPLAEFVPFVAQLKRIYDVCRT